MRKIIFICGSDVELIIMPVSSYSKNCKRYQNDNSSSQIKLPFHHSFHCQLPYIPVAHFGLEFMLIVLRNILHNCFLSSYLISVSVYYIS